MGKLSVVSGVLVTGVFVVAACGGTPTASSVPSLPGAIRSLLPSNLPTVPGAIQSLIPASVPSIGVTPDPELAARFPTSIEGATLGEVTTGHFMDVINAFEEPATTSAFVAAVTGAGLDPNSLTYGNQMVTLDETDVVQIQALRTPNADANKFVQILPTVQQIVNGEDTPDTLGSTTIDGKTVATLTDSNGHVDYVFVTGDVAWRISAGDEDQAATIIAALH